MPTQSTRQRCSAEHKLKDAVPNINSTLSHPWLMRVSSEGAAPSASSVLEANPLLPIEAADCSEIWDSKSRQAALTEALESLLVKPAIETVVGYSICRSMQFAESLYSELCKGKMDLLYNELYEGGVLRAQHCF